MTVEKAADGMWVTRLRYGCGQRDRFKIRASSRHAADAREALMVAIAKRLAAAGKHDVAHGVLEDAGLATNDELEGVEAVVLELCAESVNRRPAVSFHANTFEDVAELLFADQLRRGNSVRTIAADRQRLRSLASIRSADVAAVTSKLADDAIAALPTNVQTSRRLYEGLISRVLKHALKLELIERVPLRPGFVSPQAAPARLFQYLRVDEEATLVSGPAPLQRRLGYALMSRESVRPEFLSLFYWSDAVPADALVSTIDLESGLLTHRHKQKRVRRWSVCERVLRVLRAWRELNPSARVLPEWAHIDIAETLRQDLLDAGVPRTALHRSTATERRITAKDAGRATFVTLALRAGAPMHWVTDRTGHMSEDMVGRYNRMARESHDTVRAWLRPLDELLGGELGLEPLSEPFVAPWLQGLQGMHGPKDGASVTDLGHSLGRIIELLQGKQAVAPQAPEYQPYSAARNSSAVEPKTAVASESTAAASRPGPDHAAALGHDSPVEIALAEALRGATAAGEWVVVQTLARELSERRLERTAPTVPSLETARRARKEGR